MDNTQLVEMTELELSELNQHETVIERGLKTFVDVGSALLAIRDKRLYRMEYGTFEEYCKERWALSRPRAYQLIDAATTVNGLSTIVDKLPTNEAQARPLTKLEPEQQAEVWQRAVETAPNGKVTGAHVQTIVDEYDQQADELAEDEDAYDWTPEEQFDPTVEQQILEDTQPHSETAYGKMDVHFSSESPEHYTPDNVIALVLACLGPIALDPCSNSHDAPNVPATTHYTEDDDGLSQFWEGTVYMNPPYGNGIAAWVEKLCESYECSDVTEAIALVPARPGAQWWVRLRNHPMCLIEGRLKFKGNENSAPFPSAVFYLGDDIGKFYHTFCDLGDIWQRIEPGMFGE